MAHDAVRDQYIAKKRELSRAEAELSQMSLMTVDPKDIKAMESRIESTKIQIHEAEATLLQKYSKDLINTVSRVAKVLYPDPAALQNGIESPKKFAEEIAKPEVLSNLGAAVPGPGTGVMVAGKAIKIIDDIKEVAENSVEYLRLQQVIVGQQGALTKLMADKAQLESRDWKYNKMSLEARVKELQLDVKMHEELLAGITQQKVNPDFVPATPPAVTIENNAIKDKEYEISPVENQGKGYKKAPTVTFKGDSGKGAKAVAVLENGCITKIKVTDAGSDYSTAPNVELVYDDVPTISEKKTLEEAELEGLFQEVVIKSSDATESKKQTEDSYASSSSWNVNGWFFSASGSTKSANASANQSSYYANKEFEIGFRVAKVGFDRGGWFNPQIFKLSQAFYRLSKDIKVAKGLNVVDVKNCATMDALSKLNIWRDEDAKKDYLYALQAYPVAMIIAKDITIKIKNEQSESSSMKSVVENATASGGGIFCFSASSASSSKSTAESSYHGQHGEYYYIRIPGPQVIGYFLQFMPADNSEPFVPLMDGKDGKVSPVIEAFQLFDKAPELIKEAEANEAEKKNEPAATS